MLNCWPFNLHVGNTRGYLLPTHTIPLVTLSPRTNRWWDIPDAAAYGGDARAELLCHTAVQRGDAKFLVVNDADQTAPDLEGLSCRGGIGNESQD